MNLSNLAKKITASIFVFLCLFFLSLSQFSSLVHAEEETASTWYNQSFTGWFSKVYDNEISPDSDIFGERYTAAQVQWVVYSLISLPLTLDPESQKVVACFFGAMGDGATDPIACGKALIERFEKFNDYFMAIKKDADAQPTSIMGFISNYENREVSGIKYVTQKINRFSLVGQANAQGFGYTALNPIQKYWTGTRDIAYALVVFVTIVFAFMIMFRVKISPQIVISVQSTIPKVIVAVVLATFSYAIAGFMIDLMYVIGGFLATLIVTAGFSDPNVGVNGVYSSIFPTNKTGLYFLTHMIVYDLFFLFGIVANFLALVLAPQQWIAGAIFILIGILLVIWIFILSIFYTFTATWKLVKTLLSIYFSIITAPIQFVLGAIIPSLTFGLWFRTLLADLLVFPVTGVFMYFAYKLMWLSYKFAGSVALTENFVSRIAEMITAWGGGDMTQFNTLWVPEILGFGEAVSGILMLMMSFAIITMLPKVSDMLKGLILGAKFDYGSAIGEAMAPMMWGKKQFIDPLTGSYSQAAGRNRVLAIQDGVRKRVNDSKMPEWLKATLLANPGKE